MASSRDLLSEFRGLTLDNVGAWPMVPRVTLWLFVIAACAVGGWFALWSGQKDQLEQLQAEESKLKEEYKSKLQQAINLDELRKQREQVSQYVLTLEKQLPSKSEMDALLSDINQAGVGRGLDFELFRPGQTNVRDYYAELPITVKVAGKYHDLGAFASDIANLPRIVTLNNLAVSTGKGGNLVLDATAKTYRSLDQEREDREQRDVDEQHQRPQFAELRQPDSLESRRRAEEAVRHVLDDPDEGEPLQREDRVVDPPGDLRARWCRTFVLTGLAEQQNAAVEREEGDSGRQVEAEQAKALGAELAHHRPPEAELNAERLFRDALERVHPPEENRGEQGRRAERAHARRHPEPAKRGAGPSSGRPQPPRE